MPRWEGRGGVATRGYLKTQEISTRSATYEKSKQYFPAKNQQMVEITFFLDMKNYIFLNILQKQVLLCSKVLYGAHSNTH